MITALAVVAVLAVAGFFVVRWVLSNSWFVRLSGDGVVTIYQGIPEEIAGFSFADVEEESDVSSEDLPESYRDDVEEGKKFESLEDAESYVTAIEQRIKEIEESTEQKPDRDRKRRDS